MTYTQALALNYDDVSEALYQMRVEAYKNTHTELHVEEFDAYEQVHRCEDVRLALALAKNLTAEDFALYGEEDGALVVDYSDEAEDLAPPVYSSGASDKWAVMAFLLVAVVTVFLERGAI